MGGGRFSSDDWAQTRSTRSTQRTEQIFTRAAVHSVHPDFDPKKIKLRESRDSEDSPESLPIMVGFDVTGSMGSIPDHFARTGVGELMEGIYEKRPVADPHVAFCAIGDAQGSAHQGGLGDDAPFQVSQFEADNRVAETIGNIWIEHGGSAQDTESYDLPWWFLANRVEFDAWVKRRTKGYYFGVGDEPAPNRTYDRALMTHYFGGHFEASVTSAEMLASAQERWSVFQIVAEQGARGRKSDTRDSWIEMLGNNVLFMDDYQFMPQLIVATIQVTEGMDMDVAIHGAGKGAKTVEKAFNRIRNLGERESFFG